MNLVIGKVTDDSVLAAVRRLASYLSDISGSVSLEDRKDLYIATDSLLTIVERHTGGYA